MRLRSRSSGDGASRMLTSSRTLEGLAVDLRNDQIVEQVELGGTVARRAEDDVFAAGVWRRQQQANRFEQLIGSLTPLVDARSCRFELGSVPSGADAELVPAAREEIHRCDLFGQQDRISER